MQIISAPEADRTFNQVIDQAQHEPVMIRQQNRNVAVMLSVEEYQRIIQTNIFECNFILKKEPVIYVGF